MPRQQLDEQFSGLVASRDVNSLKAEQNSQQTAGMMDLPNVKIGLPEHPLSDGLV